MNVLEIQSTVQTMTSREIADLVESRHDSVKLSMERLAERGVITLPPLVEASFVGLDGRRQVTNEYRVSKRDTYVIVAQLSPAFTARLVDRWQELEARQAPAFKIPQSMAEALRLAADLSERMADQAKQIEAAAPAVEFVGKFVDAENTKGFRQVCKMLGANENDFRAFIVSRGIMYKLGGEWAAYSQHIDAGRFVIKQGVAGDHAFSSTRFTAKGALWIAGEWAKFNMKEAA